MAPPAWARECAPPGVGATTPDTLSRPGPSHGRPGRRNQKETKDESRNPCAVGAGKKEGDKLFFQGEFGGKSELIPKSENVFLHRRLPMRFTFVKDAGGKVTHLVRRHTLSPDVRTIDMRARKIE